jgi:hypothetical protein
VVAAKLRSAFIARIVLSAPSGSAPPRGRGCRLHLGMGGGSARRGTPKRGRSVANRTALRYVPGMRPATWCIRATVKCSPASTHRRFAPRIRPATPRGRRQGRITAHRAVRVRGAHRPSHTAVRSSGSAAIALLGPSHGTRTSHENEATPRRMSENGQAPAERNRPPVAMTYRLIPSAEELPRSATFQMEGGVAVCADR